MNDQLARAMVFCHSRPRRVFGAGAVSGAFAALGQAPFGFFPATLLGLAFGFGLWQSAANPRRAAWVGGALGFGYFLVTLHWIVEPFLVDIARHGWMAPFALPLMAAGMALFWGGGAAVAHFGRWPRLIQPLGFAAALTAAEALRGWLFTGFPWGGPGLVWIDTPVAGVASVIGVLGLSLLTFAFSAGLWRALAPRFMGWAVWIGAAVITAASGAALTPDLEVPDEAALVRLVQPNAPQHQKWDPAYVREFFQRAVALSGASDGEKPDLVIWPETSVPGLLGRDPNLDAAVAASGMGAPVIAGIFDRDGAREYNALVMFNPDGTPQWVYRKFHLVPFGEYIPLGELAARFGIYGLAAQHGAGFSAGPGAQVFEMPGAMGTVQPIICYEAIFPRDIRRAPKRPDWILQATNDGWFGQFAGPQQHLVQARFRAIEMGLPVLRAANTGVTAAIDSTGRVVAHLPLGTAGKLDVRIPPARSETLFARFGQGPLVFILILFIASFVLPLRAKDIDRTGRAQ